MATVATNPKQQAHELIERMTAGQVAAVVGLLEAMLDPVDRAIANAPLEDEPISEEEERAVAASKEWLKKNKPIPNEEVLAEFGLSWRISSAWGVHRSNPIRALKADRDGKEESRVDGPGKGGPSRHRPVYGPAHPA